MSKWLQAARSARASKPGFGPLYASANSANSANRALRGAIGTIGAIGREVDGLITDAPLAVVPDLSDPEDAQVWINERGTTSERTGTNSNIAAPRDWAAGVARLIGTNPPMDYTEERWRRLVKGAEHFIATWAGQAAALGWSTEEVFGCHRRAPAARYDAAGLVAMLGGGRIVVMTAAGATIENTRGARLNHRRQLTARECERAILWELTTEQWDADADAFNTEATSPGHDGDIGKD